MLLITIMISVLYSILIEMYTGEHQGGFLRITFGRGRQSLPTKKLRIKTAAPLYTGIFAVLSHEQSNKQ